jgi:tRNA A-37 threonylcarbamoyl transferase component Bud32
VASTIPPRPDTAGFTAGYRISGYRLEQQIGRGGMAAVFSAYDERLERQVALKILDPAMARDEVFRQRFLAESRAAAAVEDPHIIPVYEAGEADGVLFISMRLVPGGDLRSLVARRGPLAPARAEWILSAVASALDAAHACGLVHRDVKPANMLLDVRPGRRDHVYLSDFGVSKASMSPTGLTTNGQFIGTVDYAAPEQILGQPVDGRTDQYALGCAAFELLCGHPPYSRTQWPATMYSHLSAPPPVARSERPELPAAVDSVFARVLAKSPADRYGSCQEFTGALRAALGLKTYVADAPAAPDQAHLEPGGAGDATVDPDAANRFAFRVRGPGGVGTDPRATSQLTVGRSDRRSRRVLASVAVAAIVIAGAVAAILFGRAHTPAPASRYRFAARSYPGGLAVRQVWTLAGSRGSSLDVSMTVSNDSSNAVSAQLEEPIPVAIARDPGSVTFTSAVTPLVTSPLVVWDLRLPAHGYDVVSYQVTEAPGGASKERLMTYVHAYVAVSAQQTLEVIARPGLVTRVWISPLKLWLNVGQTRQLAVHGRLYNGRLAPLADLAGAVWTTTNPAVLSVNRSGWVVGVSPGKVLVWVQIGGIRAQAVAVVSRPGGAASPPVYISQPPVQSSPAPSPTPSGSATPTATPSTSGSPPPTSPPPTSAPPTPQPP